MIIFLYGHDTYRSRKKLKELKKKFLHEVDKDGNSLAFVDGESASLEKINETVAAPSLFVKKRMIIIERIFNNKKTSVIDDVHEYLKASEKKESDNIIIFWDEVSRDEKSKSKLFQYLAKQKYAQEFKPFSNTDIVNWIKKETEKKGAKIKQSAAFLLVSLAGNNLWQVSNEINKLISYKASQADKLLNVGNKSVIIEEEDVKAIVRGNFDENIFALTDAISNRNKALALKLFEGEIEAGINESYLMHMVIRQFSLLLQVRQALDNGFTSRKIVSQLKIHPFVVQKCLNQVRSFSLPILKKTFNELLNIDRLVKSGQGDVVTMLNLLIVKI